MAKTSKLSELGMWNLVRGVRSLTYLCIVDAWNIVYMSTITTMVTMLNFEIVKAKSGNLNV